MEKRTYEDLRKRFQNRQDFVRLIEANEDKVNQLRALFGIDFNDLRTRLPSEQELVEALERNTGFKGHSKIGFNNPKAVVETAIDMLLESFDKSAEREKQMQQDLLGLKLADFDDLEKRIKLDILQQDGFIDLYRQHIIPKESIITYLYSDEPLFREQYFKARVIRPEELAAVIKRFGYASVLNSLPEGSEKKNEINDYKMALEVSLNDIPLPLRLHPAEVRQKHKDIHDIATWLYKRYEWALKDLTQGSNVLNSSLEVKKQAYKIFVDAGADEARNFLTRYNVRPSVRERLLTQFYERYHDFTGQGSRIRTSEYEDYVGQVLAQKGIFFRRQVPYSEIMDTKGRRFVMDFLVEGPRVKTIIEVPDNTNPKYLANLREKGDLAMKSGHNFLLLPEGKEVDIRDALKPSKAYDLGEPDFQMIEAMPSLPRAKDRISPGRADNRRVYFANNPSLSAQNVYMIGHMRREQRDNA